MVAHGDRGYWVKSQSDENKLNDWLIVSFLVAFTLIFRLLTLQMINVGPDEIDYWYYAKILFSKIPYGELNHRNIRWGIILPTFLIQRIFGTHPIIYIFGPIMLSCVQSYLTYDLGKRLFNRGTGILAVLMLTVFPYMIRTGSQIRPGIFSLTYLLAAFWVIVQNLDAFRTEKGWWGAVVAAAALVFCAYQTKITNLYFLPFFAVTVYSVAGKRLKPLAMFLVLLAAAYLVEHLLYFLGIGAPFGRLSIITATHLESSYAEDLERCTFLGLFDRFSNKDFPLVWKVVFLLYFVSAVFLAFRWKGSDKRLWNRLVAVLVFSFTFLLTFAVKSIRPVIPMEAFHNRYFTPLLPWIFLMIGAGIMELPDPVGRILACLTERWATVGIVLCVILLLFVGMFHFKLYPDSFAEYAPELSKARKHVIHLYMSYTRLVNQAWQGELPIVSVSSGKGGSSKAIDTVNRVFLNWREHEIERQKPRIVAEGYSYQFIAREEIEYDKDYLMSIEGKQILAVDRFPLRVWITTLQEERQRLK
jgi:4-amino-4-deoxy-L-arabinose transferase-like glycosyltransferase